MPGGSIWRILRLEFDHTPQGAKRWVQQRNTIDVKDQWCAPAPKFWPGPHTVPQAPTPPWKTKPIPGMDDAEAQWDESDPDMRQFTGTLRDEEGYVIMGEMRPIPGEEDDGDDE